MYWSCCHHLTQKKSVGSDSISPQVLKEARHQIAPILTFICNQSLSSGFVPDDWCTVNIFVLHKKDPKDLAENYWPISLTLISSKILEHIVYSSISRFLENNSILTPRQHGFHTGHSCETQLVHAINDWAKALDHEYQSDVAIFDFSKAFDSVPHWHWLHAPLPLICLEDGSYSWRLAAHCGHSNAPVEYAIKEEEVDDANKNKQEG